MRLVGIALTLLTSLGCGDAKEAPLLVCAASDLQDVSGPLAERFAAETGANVEFNIGASGTLVQQIEAGARADVFASANVAFVERLERGGFVQEGSKRVYAKGRLVLVAAQRAPRLQTLDDLRKPEFAKIAIANPETAPYGSAAKAALTAAGLADVLQPKLIIAENVRQAYQYVALGEVDAAFVSASLASAAADRTLVVPETLYPPLLQAVAVLKSSKRPQDAKRFVEFLTGEQGRALLTKCGFAVPPEGSTHP